jgi:hypothetical protein
MHPSCDPGHQGVVLNAIEGKHDTLPTLVGFPPTVRIVRAGHPLEGRSLKLTGWMR